MVGTMQALKLQKEKDDKGRSKLVFVDTPIPQPKAGQARIRVLAAALNHRDNWITMGMYPRIKMGTTLGSDCVGIVDATGAGAGCKLGERVLVDPSVAWGPRPEAPGKGFSILGMPTDGTFAEHVVVPAENVHPCPSHLTDSEAAALPLAGATAWRCLTTKGAVKKGSKVFITGIGGGVALFALQFAVALGAEVTVSSGSPEKLERAQKEFGAAHGVNYKEKGWAKKLQKKGGFDCIVDGAGGAAFDDLIRMLRPGGKLVSYGVTAGPPKRVTLPNLFLNNADIVGTAMSNGQEFQDMLECVTKNRIKPVVSAQMPHTEASSLLEVMRSGAQFGKLVMNFPKARL